MTAAKDKSDIAHAPSGEPAISAPGVIDAFLGQARRLAPVAGEAQARLVFALDATMSRQPTWDTAMAVQAGMFETAAELGGLAVQLVYFRGFGECRNSRWVADPREMTALMTRIACQGGHTQIARVLRHVRNETGRTGVKALIYVGDAMEEPLDDLCALAGELGLLGVKAFMFHEGHDPVAAQAFREIARLTGGAYARFDSAAPGSLAALLRTAAAYASGGEAALRQLAEGSREAGEVVAQITASR